MIRSFSETPAPNPAIPADFHSATGLDALAHRHAETEAVIERVSGEPAQRRRLLEAGFTAGCPVRFVMATPFGDPLVFSLRGASIALRKSEARCVRVRLGNAS